MFGGYKRNYYLLILLIVVACSYTVSAQEGGQNIRSSMPVTQTRSTEKRTAGQLEPLVHLH